MDTTTQDLKFAIRMLAKSPGFTLIAVLTLALGIGANTAIFSVVNAVLLRPLPFKDASQLVRLRETYKLVGNVSVSYPDFLDWRQQSHAFADMSVVNNVNFNLSGIAQPENIAGYAVSPNFLTLLGVSPILGRDLLPSEEKPGTAPVALLSYQLWQSHLGGDPAVIGRSITLDGRSFSIVGVLPATFRFLDTTDVIVPIGFFAADFTDRAQRGDTDVVGRLAPGVTLSQAALEMNTIAARLAQQYPQTNHGFGAHLESLREAFTGDTRLAVLVLFGAVVFVLLIACVNVANLFLVRGAARAREIALRQAFGASRGRLIRQMLTESLVLAFCGGALGLILGAWGISGLGHLLPADSMQMMGVRMDLSVLLFAAAMIALVTFAFGLIPALQATRPDVHETLKEGGRSATSTRGQHRLRGALAIAETALALVLLVGAGLMLKSLYHLIQVSPGFQPARVLYMEMDLRTDQYSKDPAILNFWQQVLDRVRVIPGVESAALGTVVPLTGNHRRSDITIEGLPIPGPGEFPHPDRHTVSADYITTMGTPLLRGRNFSDADNETAPDVALINSTMARRFFTDGDAIGKRFLWGHPGKDEKWITIVGVVADTKLYGLDNPARLEVYSPYRQRPSADMNLVVRSAVDPASLTSAIRSAVAAIDKDQPIFDVHTMQQLVDDSISTRRLTLVLLGIFSALALILAAIGIYGVMAYTVALRTQEIGIRMALGAQQKDVLRLVLGQGARIAFFGVAIGLAAAAALGRLLSSLLFSVSASDPITFAAVAVLLISVALLACYIPARRAMRVDPLIALRHE
ncbi:MAG: ABC transporter permease [Candidatus Acidiferrales bacterium]|jgi:putative ABC transport system permease protein